MRRRDCACSHLIVARENCRRRFVLCKKLLGRVCPRLKPEISIFDHIFVWLDSTTFECILVSKLPEHCGSMPGKAFNEADPLMPQ